MKAAKPIIDSQVEYVSLRLPSVKPIIATIGKALIPAKPLSSKVIIFSF